MAHSYKNQQPRQQEENIANEDNSNETELDRVITREVVKPRPRPSSNGRKQVSSEACEHTTRGCTEETSSFEFEKRWPRPRPNPRSLYEIAHQSPEYSFPDNVIYDDAMFSSDLEDNSLSLRSSSQATPVDDLPTEQKEDNYICIEDNVNQRIASNGFKETKADSDIINNMAENDGNIQIVGLCGTSNNRSYRPSDHCTTVLNDDELTIVEETNIENLASDEKQRTTPLNFTNYLLSGVQDYLVPIAAHCRPYMHSSSDDNVLTVNNQVTSHNSIVRESSSISQKKKRRDKYKDANTVRLESIEERGKDRSPPPASSLPPVPVRWLEDITMSLAGMLDTCKQVVSKSIDSDSTTPTPPLPAEIMAVDESWYFGGGPTLADSLLNDETLPKLETLTSAFIPVCGTVPCDQDDVFRIEDTKQVTSEEYTRERIGQSNVDPTLFSAPTNLTHIDTNDILNIYPSFGHTHPTDTESDDMLKEDFSKYNRKNAQTTEQKFENVDDQWFEHSATRNVEEFYNMIYSDDRHWDEIIPCNTNRSAVEEVESEDDVTLIDVYQRPINRTSAVTESAADDSGEINKENNVEETYDVNNLHIGVFASEKKFDNLPESDHILFGNGNFILESETSSLDYQPLPLVASSRVIDCETGEMKSKLNVQQTSADDVPAAYSNHVKNSEKPVLKRHHLNVRSDTVLTHVTTKCDMSGNEDVQCKSYLSRKVSLQEPCSQYSINSLADDSIEDILMVEKRCIGGGGNMEVKKRIYSSVSEDKQVNHTTEEQIRLLDDALQDISLINEENVECLQVERDGCNTTISRSNQDEIQDDIQEEGLVHTGTAFAGRYTNQVDDKVSSHMK